MCLPPLIYTEGGMASPNNNGSTSSEALYNTLKKSTELSNFLKKQLNEMSVEWIFEAARLTYLAKCGSGVATLPNYYT